jgi:phosphate transport system permease protein
MKSHNEKPAGEPLVWLTSMGLVLGISMVVYLLSVIFCNGVTVFWPKAVHEVRLKESGPENIGGEKTFFGIVTMEREKLSAGLSGGDAEGIHEEYQFFTGNKDIYSFMYKFVSKDQVESMATPGDILVGERLEYGNALFRPLQIEYADGKTIPALDPGFTQTLHQLLDEGNKRRAEYTKIEKRDIGRINAEMEKIRIRMLALENAHGEDYESLPEAQRHIARQEVLEKDYADLEGKAGKLREKQEEALLTYQVGTGDENTLPVAHFTDIYAPNQFGFGDKAAFFARKFWAFLSESPREANMEGGIFPAIFGTFVMTLLMSAAVMPFGVIAAIYLREYAKQGWMVRSVRIAVNNLAGVPSIVFGVFGLGFFVYFVGGTIDNLFFTDRLLDNTPTFGTGGVLWASLTLALMTVPVVVVATEEALASVPRGVREASLACGASKWQTIQRIVLPASAPGILTGLILAMARGAGEVAPLMLVGVVKLAPDLPLDSIAPFLHLERKFMHLGFHIYDLGFQSPDSEAAKPMVFATTFLLILLVVVMNLFAIVIRNHLRKKYSSSVF